MFSLLVLLLITVVGTAFFLFAPGTYWLLGTVILLLTWLGYLIFVFPRRLASSRGALAFLGWYMLAAVIIASAIIWSIQANEVALKLQFESLNSLDYFEERVLSLLAGGFLGFVLTLIFFLMVGYFSSIYVLALHEEDMSFFTAFKSFIFLIFNFSLAWLVVEDGKIIEVKKQGFSSNWLSRGKIFVKPGMAIVTDRGGRITGIHGPGVVFTQKNERIRDYFDLRPQFLVQKFEAITADRIPVTVEMGIGYRIIPAQEQKNWQEKKNEKANLQENGATANGRSQINVTGTQKLESEDKANGTSQINGTAGTQNQENEDKANSASQVEKSKDGSITNDTLITDNESAFEVMRSTLVKAAFENTAGTWKGLGGGAPVAQLRDHFMGHTLDELFKLDSTVGVRPNARRIKQIENTILDSLNDFGPTKGIIWTTVDILDIRMPGKMMEGMTESAAIDRISQQRNKASQKQINDILETITNFTGRPIGDVELQMATEFVRMSKRGLTDDILGHEYVQMLRELAKSDGPKIFTPPNMGMELKDIV